MAVDLGDVHRLVHTHTNAAGNLVTAGSMQLTITRPDSTAVTVSPVTATSVGRYEHLYLTEQAGRHAVRWVGTGVNAGASTDVFDVQALEPGYILSVDAAKLHLNLTGTTEDEELRGFVEACTPVVEDVVGPVVVRPFTEVQHGGPLLVLNHVPAISVTTLAPLLTGGVAVLPAEVDLDPATGIVRRLDGARFVGPLRVTYLAGRRVVPANIVKGCAEILRHAWSTQRMPSMGRPGFGGEDEDMAMTPSGFLIPHRAMGWLQPHKRGPVLA